MSTRTSSKRVRQALTLLLLSLAAVASAQDKDVVYNAATKKFEPEDIGALRNGSRLTVKVKNANTFTHSYKLAAQAINHFPQAVPGPLGSLILQVKPQPTDAKINVNDQNMFNFYDTPNVTNEYFDNFWKSVELFDLSYQRFDFVTVWPTVSVGGKQVPVPAACGMDKDLDAIALNPKLSDQRVLEEMNAKVLLIVGDGEPESRIKEKLISPIESQMELASKSFEGETESNIVGRHIPGINKAFGVLEESFLSLLQHATDNASLLKLNSAKEAFAMATRKRDRSIGELDKFNSEGKSGLDRAQNTLKYLRLAKKAAEESEVGFVIGVVNADLDELKISVEQLPSEAFTKRASVPGASAIPTKSTYVLSIPVYGRQVLDFSMGAMKSDLTDANYYKNSSNIVAKGETGDGDYQLLALAHYYVTQRPGSLVVTPSLGLSLTSGKPRYLLGASLVIPGSARLYLTVGFAMGEMTVLNGMQVGEDIGAQTLRTAKVNRSGGFVGLSFRFVTN